MAEQEIAKKVKKRKLILNIIVFAAFVLFSVAMMFVFFPKFKAFYADPESFRSYIARGARGVIVFLLIQILQIVVSVIPGEIVEVGAGITFGWFYGLLLCELGCFIASSFIYFFAKKVGKPVIRAFVGDKKFAKFVSLGDHPFRDRAIFLIYFLPGIPKDILTFVVPFFKIGFWKFQFLLLVGRIPSIVTSTYAGDAIFHHDFKRAILVFLITGVIAVICYLAGDRLISRMKKKEVKLLRPKYKAFLLDLDDTLLDFQRSETEAILKTLKKIGFKITPGVLTAYKEINEKYWREYEKGKILKDDIFILRFEELFQRYRFTYADLAAVNDLYFSYLGRAAYFLPGAHAFLKQSAKLMPLYGITNGVASVERARIAKLKLSRYLKKIYISEEMGTRKPEAAFFDCVLNDLDLKKADVIVLGDSLTSDVLGAVRAGVDVIWYNPKKLFPNAVQPTYSATRYRDVFPFLKEPE